MRSLQTGWCQAEAATEELGDSAASQPNASLAQNASIAQCKSSGGSLACDEIYARVDPSDPLSNDPKDCPDDLSRGKFMTIRAITARRRRGTSYEQMAKTKCVQFTGTLARKKMTVFLDKNHPIPQAKHVLTKAGVFKNHGGSQNTGLIIFKRVVCASDDACATFKSVRCIDCSSIDPETLTRHNRRTGLWFKSKWADSVPDYQIEMFAASCVPKAFNETMQKDEFLCSEKDEGYASKTIMTW